MEKATMEKATMKQFIASSNISPALIRAVVRQSGGWESFCESAPDIANHGIDGGFHGWIYHHETTGFFRSNRALILELAEEQAQSLGQGMLEMVTGFGVFRHSPITVDAVARAIYQGKGDDVTTVQNVMSWFAAEEVARAYVDFIED